MNHPDPGLAPFPRESSAPPSLAAARALHRRQRALVVASLLAHPGARCAAERGASRRGLDRL